MPTNHSTPPAAALAARLELARNLAAQAGKLAFTHYQQPSLIVERKADGSAVTPSDRNAEILIRSGIAAKFPDDAICGEEFAPQQGSSGWRWYIDPIDGTGSYTRGMPTFCCLIGLEYKGVCHGGAIELPALNESIWGGSGLGVHWKTSGGSQVAARVSERTDMAAAYVELGTPMTFAQHQVAAVHNAICNAAGKTHGWNDGFSFALALTGRADAAIHVGLKPWDAAAFIALFREAGGMMTNWSSGCDLDDGNFLAAGPGIHTKLLKLIAASVS